MNHVEGVPARTKRNFRILVTNWYWLLRNFQQMGTWYRRNFRIRVPLARVPLVTGYRGKPEEVNEMKCWSNDLSPKNWRYFSEEMSFRQRGILCVILTFSIELTVLTPCIVNCKLVSNLKVSDWVEALNSSAPIWDFSESLVNFKK